jgi:hypothetical protein
MNEMVVPGAASETTSTDFSCSFVTSKSAAAIYEGILDVRGWWSENIEGSPGALGTDWIYDNRPVHLARFRVAELVPGRRVVWDVLENMLSFVKDQSEWVGDRLVFEITPEGNGHRLTFTQHGLTPADQCYDICDNAWTGYIAGSLRARIEVGKGSPVNKFS